MRTITLLSLNRVESIIVSVSEKNKLFGVILSRSCIILLMDRPVFSGHTVYHIEKKRLKPPRACFVDQNEKEIMIT